MRRAELGVFELKSIHKETVLAALEKAERYRLLNEPGEAESICLDVLRIDPENQQALVALLLALTDQFEEGFADRVKRAREVLPRVRDDYARAYYAGIICERRAKAQLKQGGPGSGYVAYDSFHAAMSWYEKAETLRPTGNDDALLRWNTCARILMRNPHIQPGPVDRSEPPLE
jgi:tetratricopeptide (TPR) repeat protein